MCSIFCISSLLLMTQIYNELFRENPIVIKLRMCIIIEEVLEFRHRSYFLPEIVLMLMIYYD